MKTYWLDARSETQPPRAGPAETGQLRPPVKPAKPAGPPPQPVKPLPQPVKPLPQPAIPQPKPASPPKVRRPATPERPKPPASPPVVNHVVRPPNPVKVALPPKPPSPVKAPPVTNNVQTMAPPTTPTPVINSTVNNHTPVPRSKAMDDGVLNNIAPGRAVLKMHRSRLCRILWNQTKETGTILHHLNFYMFMGISRPCEITLVGLLGRIQGFCFSLGGGGILQLDKYRLLRKHWRIYIRVVYAGLVFPHTVHPHPHEVTTVSLWKLCR